MCTKLPRVSNTAVVNDVSTKSFTSCEILIGPYNEFINKLIILSESASVKHSFASLLVNSTIASFSLTLNGVCINLNIF